MPPAPPSPNGRAGAPPALGDHVSELLRLPDGTPAWLDAAPAYDLITSLIATAQPGAKGQARTWATLARDEYTAAQWERIRLWFGGDTPLGAAYEAVVPLLPGAGEPAALCQAIEGMPLGDFLRVALTAGSINPDAPLATSDLLPLTASAVAARAYVDRYLRVLGKRRALLLRLLADPEAARAELVGLLRLQSERLYARLAPEMDALRARAVERLRALATSRPEILAGWMRGTIEPAGFAPLILVPLASWHTYSGHYLHESRQPLFDGSAYEPLLVLMGATRVLAEEPLVPAPADPAERWASLFAALADPTRLRLLRLLAKRPHYGQELAPALGVSGPTISHHLNALHRADIVTIERQAHRTYLVLRREALSALLEAGGQFILGESAPSDESAHEEQETE